MSADVSKIGDYALIGDARSAALISRRGSLDWLCWPRFDSPLIFGAIVDPKIGGHWSIRPTRDSQISRRYIDNTNVLETTLATDSGKIVLTDFMPVATEEEKRRRLWPEQELIRQIKCSDGEVPATMEFHPRPDYGRVPAKIRRAGKFGWRTNVGRDVLWLRSEIDLECDGDSLSARTTLKSGDVISFSLTYSRESPAVLPPLGDLVTQKLNLSINCWQQWSDQIKYDGPYRKQVVRSALVLSLLTYAPSGALVAAATSSLPECIGGELNWDYRFCWLRDAALAVRALFALGYETDAEAFVSWLLHATRLTRPELKTLYDVHGNYIPRERDLGHLAGYKNSRPVRLGNAASEQFQLDVYGEVIDAVSHFIQGDKKIDRETQKMLRQYGDYVCRCWQEPDNGMWESRGPRQQFTQSRMLCWAALDRLLDLANRGHLSNLNIDKVSRVRDQIRKEIEVRGWNEKLQSYTQVFDGDTVDANALLLVIYGFADPNSERMQKTHARLREKLSPKPGLMYRDEDSPKKGEGAFGVCNFWEADFRARAGEIDEAHRAFKAVLAYASDVDLFAEEIDPETGDALGNFPQAFTHLGLINAALSISEAEQRANGTEL